MRALASYSTPTDPDEFEWPDESHRNRISSAIEHKKVGHLNEILENFGHLVTPEHLNLAIGVNHPEITQIIVSAISKHNPIP